MNHLDADVAIVGAGPVGLMCSYLGQLCGLKTILIDKSAEPLKVGRADALNARTLQLLELVDLFDELYPLGLACNTSSVWENGRFVSRQSHWWQSLKGSLHKHFLMLGQSHVEKLLDQKLKEMQNPVLRNQEVADIALDENGCSISLAGAQNIKAKYLIGADGSRSFVREYFKIPFQIHRPQMVWAVLDAEIETDFPRVPEIINFQCESSDVAWIPREGNIERFYIRMDRKNFTMDEVLEKIQKAIVPHKMIIKRLEWFSQFSVKESVAENFRKSKRVFLAGDSCHIHSVNGGQGLNTGLADAFNLMWKLKRVLKNEAEEALLDSYEIERKEVAMSVIESSGELVRSTKFSKSGTHAQDYVKIVEKRAANITGMGIRYSDKGMEGTRLYDMEIFSSGEKKTRLYSLLNYQNYYLLLFTQKRKKVKWQLPTGTKVLHISTKAALSQCWTEDTSYQNVAVLVRPDAYIEKVISLESNLESTKERIR